MHLMEYASYDGLGLAKLIKQGDVSKREVIDAASHAIATLNPRLNFIAQECHF